MGMADGWMWVGVGDGFDVISGVLGEERVIVGKDRFGKACYEISSLRFK